MEQAQLRGAAELHDLPELLQDRRRARRRLEGRHPDEPPEAEHAVAGAPRVRDPADRGPTGTEARLGPHATLPRSLRVRVERGGVPQCSRRRHRRGCARSGRAPGRLSALWTRDAAGPRPLLKRRTVSGCTTRTLGVCIDVKSAVDEPMFRVGVADDILDPLVHAARLFSR